jgi:tetratricopeptide (TPR) repeat protein
MAEEHSDYYTEIRLKPLSSGESAQLVRNLLEIEDLPVRVRQLIVSKAEGNPFFLEEILRAMIDLGAIQHDPTSRRWRATEQIESLAIPDTVQGVILARLDRLEEEVKGVLRVAAVIGRNFLYRVLRVVVEDGEGLDEYLARLQASELILEKQRLPELEYLFKHALAQEATYASILLQKRRELHAEVGQAIETLFQARLEQFYGQLAHHYALAEAWDKAQFYLLKAGDQAGSIAADAEALNHYQQAVAAYERAFGGRLDPVQQAVLSRKMGQALVRRGEHSKAFQYLNDGLAHLGYPLPSTRWGIRRSILIELVRQAGHRFLPGRLLKQAAISPGQSIQEAVQLHIELLEIAVVSDPELLLMLALRLLNYSEQNGSLPGVVMGASAFGAVADFIPIFALAGYYHQYAVTLADQIQHPHAVGIAYQILTLHEFYLGKWVTAIEHGYRSTEAHRKTGNLHGWGWATYLMACIEIYQSNFPQAQKFGQDLIQSGQDGADLLVWCLGHDVLGFVSQRVGHLEAAISNHQKAIELAEAVPDILTRIGAGAKLGQSYLRAGKLQPALEALEASYRLSLEHKEPHHFATLCNALADAYLFAAEQTPYGDPERGELMEKAGKFGLTALKRANAFRGRRSEALRLRGRYAWLQGNAAVAQRWWQKSMAEAELQQMPYELGLTNLEIGRRTGERAYLEKAEVIFARIGAELDLERTRILKRG